MSFASSPVARIGRSDFIIIPLLLERVTYVVGFEDSGFAIAEWLFSVKGLVHKVLRSLAVQWLYDRFFISTHVKGKAVWVICFYVWFWT